MATLFSDISSFTVCFGTAIGLWRYKQMIPTYHPLAWLLVGGFITEVGNDVLRNLGYSNSVLFNLFTLYEITVILWLYHCWQPTYWIGKAIRPLLLLTTLVWLIENFVISTMHVYNSYFIVGSSFGIVLVSMQMMNVSIWEENGNLLKSTKFLTGVAVTLYFSFSFLTEIFWIYGKDKYPYLQAGVYDLVMYINIVSNILFALALLWAPP